LLPEAGEVTDGSTLTPLRGTYKRYVPAVVPRKKVKDSCLSGGIGSSKDSESVVEINFDIFKLSPVFYFNTMKHRKNLIYG
jgi:hypothetical protein